MRALRQWLSLLLSLGLLSPRARAQARIAPVEAVGAVAPAVVPQVHAVHRALTSPAPSIEILSIPPAAGTLPELAPAAPAPPAAAPAAAKTGFERKIRALAAGIAEDGQAAAEPADGGRAAADRQFRKLSGEETAGGKDEDFASMIEESLSGLESGKGSALSASADILQVEGIDFTERQLRRVSRTSAALEKAVALAAGTVFKGAVVQVRSRGSSARLTHSEGNPDYDLMARLPEAWTPAEAAAAVEGNLPALKAALAESVRRETAALFPGVATKVLVENPVPLNDPADGRRAEGVYMLPVHVGGPSGMLIDADVSFTRRADYANDYPDYFDAQLADVRRLGGEEAAAQILRDIRLAKRLFSDVLGSYKPWRGGPSGVGVEQLIMQSGRVSDVDKGRTVLGVGSFDRFMERVHAAAFEEDGSSRGFKKGKKAWTVHNPFMRPDNFLGLMSQGAWNRLASAAKLYREAKVVGRPILLDALRWEKPVAREVVEPGKLTLEMLGRFTQNGPAPARRGDAYLYAQGAKALPEGLEASRAARPDERLEEDGRYGRARTLLLRRNGRTYVMLETHNEEGSPVRRPVQVSNRLAQGIVNDTLVEVAHDEQDIRSVRPIGAYSADVVVGRVARLPEGLRLTPLFAHDAAKALYEPLPISGRVQEGEIVQALVRPARGTYEAVPLLPLLPLGTTLTPEVAAREIALRQGARGYFEEAVIRQAEEIGRTQDPDADFRRMRESKGRSEDLRELPFVTIDPVGAGDLDDAYYVRKEADGGYTWYLATADVAQYVRPGTPAFRAAARIGNTFYSVDKDGTPEYPMNHPVVSKFVSSLLAGKDSLAMVSKMRFSPTGEFLLDESEVFLGLVRVQGRYTYDQVAALWKGETGHGIAHVEQVALARELSAKLDARDGDRGKLKLHFRQTAHRKGPDGKWTTVVVEEDPLVEESHQLIEELKVHGNRAIAVRLEAIAKEAGIPHISRVHPAQEERVNERLRGELSEIGVPWPAGETLGRYLERLRARTDLRDEVRETAQLLALRSRSSALYSADDAEGHEGLALEAKAYDHPSAPIRRFSDMYNRAILEADLEGSSPKAVYEAVLADLRALGFESFGEYLLHLNGREQAARSMGHEMDEFMSVYMLAKPENQSRPLAGYVKMRREGRNAEAVIQLRGIPATITLRDEKARGLVLLDKVRVVVRGADPSRLKVDADIRVVGKK